MGLNAVCPFPALNLEAEAGLVILERINTEKNYGQSPVIYTLK